MARVLAVQQGLCGIVWLQLCFALDRGDGVSYALQPLGGVNAPEEATPEARALCNANGALPRQHLGAPPLIQRLQLCLGLQPCINVCQASAVVICSPPAGSDVALAKSCCTYSPVWNALPRRGGSTEPSATIARMVNAHSTRPAAMHMK